MAEIWRLIHLSFCTFEASTGLLIKELTSKMNSEVFIKMFSSKFGKDGTLFDLVWKENLNDLGRKAKTKHKTLVAFSALLSLIDIKWLKKMLVSTENFCRDYGYYYCS